MNDVSPHEVRNRRDDEFLYHEIVRKTQSIVDDRCVPAIVRMSHSTYVRAERLELAGTDGAFYYLGAAGVLFDDSIPENDIKFVSMLRPGCFTYEDVPPEKQ